jgi:hypothetical protein
MTTRFAEVLGPIHRRLLVPHPARSRILLEISADMEDMFQHFRDQGMTEAEARRKVIETFDLSDEALGELVRVHTSFARRLLDRLSVQAPSRWERVLLTLVILFLLISSGGLLARGEIIRNAGPAVWPVLALMLWALLLGAAKTRQIYMGGDYDVRRLQAGLAVILVLAVTQVTVAFFEAWFMLYLFARNSMAEIELTGINLMNWLMSSSALMAISMTTAILTALVWFFLAGRVARIEEGEAAILFQGGGPDSNQHAEAGPKPVS